MSVPNAVWEWELDGIGTSSWHENKSEKWEWQWKGIGMWNAIAGELCCTVLVRQRESADRARRWLVDAVRQTTVSWALLSRVQDVVPLDLHHSTSSTLNSGAVCPADTYNGSIHTVAHSVNRPFIKYYQPAAESDPETGVYERPMQPLRMHSTTLVASRVHWCKHTV